MIVGDYTEQQRTNRKGKTVTDKIVTSTTGARYAIGKRLGAGGVAKAFRAKRLSDGLLCVFKEYEPSPENRRMHMAIKKNIKKLMASPITESDGTIRLKSFVGPLDKDSLIELPASKSFGYIMELVDTKTFLPLPKLWHADTYPDASILCEAGINIASLFKRVHFRGWCYKDINEANIYINNKTGEVRVIDCDNISVQNVRTVSGTQGYMAPEVYVSSTPDGLTDYFSMAVLFYRLFVGGFPLDGKKTREYLVQNDLSITEAASTIYGSMALFAFDPKDHSNDLHDPKNPRKFLVDPLNPKLYEIQTQRWNRLPSAIQKGFIATFSTGLKERDRHKRFTDTDWERAFTGLKRACVVTCRCGKKTFADPERELTCIFCGKTIPRIKKPAPPKPAPPKPAPPKPAPPKPQPPKPPTTGELTTVVFKVRRDIAPTHLQMQAKRKAKIPGKAILQGLNDGWMKIQYSKKRNLLAAVNQSSHEWIISVKAADGTVKKSRCAPGKKVILHKGVTITVVPHRLKLAVSEIK